MSDHPTQHEPYAMPTRVLDVPDIADMRARFRRKSKLIPLKQASRMIGLDAKTLTVFVTQRRHACPFPVIRDGVRYHVREEEVLDYIAQNRALVAKRFELRRQGENVRRAYKAIK